MSSKIEELDKQNDLFQDEIATNKAEILQKSSEVERLGSELDNWRQKHSASERENMQLQSKKDVLERDIETHKAAYGNAVSEHQTKIGEVNGMVENLTQANDQNQV